MDSKDIYNTKLNNTIKINKFSVYFYLTLYKFTLDFIYKFVISKTYGYQNFIFDFNIYKYVVSIIMFIFMLDPICRLMYKRKTSDMIILLISLVYFIPGLSLLALTDQSNEYFLFFSIYWISLLLFQNILPSIKKKHIEKRESGIIFNIIIITFAVFLLIISGIYTNFRIDFNMLNIYDLRLEARTFNMPVILQYMHGAAHTIVPLGSIYYIVNKNKIMSVFLILIQLLSFSFNGKKSVLFALILIIIIGLLYKKEHIRLIIPSFLVLNIIAIVEFCARKGVSQIINFIHRRVMFLPPRIGYHYYQFFSNNELDYLRQSIFRWFGAVSPYSNISIQRMIGLIYFGDIQNNANTGLVGDAFANFGWMGLFFYPLMIILALRILDYCSKGLDYRIDAVLWILIFYTFISGSFFTIMLNNGFILTCITLYFCPKINESEIKQN